MLLTEFSRMMMMAQRYVYQRLASWRSGVDPDYYFLKAFADCHV